jgi:hypothetical protein
VIKYKQNFKGRITNVPLESRVAYLLDGDEHGMGAIEATAATSQNNSRAIAMILQLLHDRRHISLKDIVTLLDRFDFSATGGEYVSED